MLDFLLRGMHRSWAGRNWCLNSDQLSWNPLLLESSPTGFLQAGPWRGQCYLSWSPRFWSYLVPCFLHAGSWSSPFHGHCSDTTCHPADCTKLFRMSGLVTWMIIQRFCEKRFYRECRKCDLTKFIGTVHSIIYYMNGIENRRRFWVENYLYRSKRKVYGVRESLPLSHLVCKGPPCFLNPCSERSLGAAGSRPGLRQQRFMSKGYV